MQQDPYAAFGTPVSGAGSQGAAVDPWAAFGTPVSEPSAPSRRAPAAAAPMAEPVAPMDETTNGFTTDQVPMDLGTPGSQGNPINTALMDDAARLALTPGTWIVGPKGEPRQLSGAPSRSAAQPGDIQAGGQNFREQGGEGYNQALVEEKRIEEMAPVGFGQQPTAPFNDEIAWLAGAARQLPVNIVERLMGGDPEVSVMGRANAARDAAKASQREYERENPLLSATGQILGGFAAGPAAGARAGLLGRLGQSAAWGAAYGAAEGEGLEDRAVKGTLGGGLGLAAGGLLEGVIGGGRAAVGALRNRSIPQAQRESNRVGDFLARSLRRDDRSLVDVERRLAENPNLLPFEAGGRNLAATAEAAASYPGRAQQVIGERLGERAEQATGRIRDAASREIGGSGNFFADLDDSLAARALQARTGMEQFGSRPIVLNADAQTAISSPRVRTALADSADNLLSSIDPVEREAGARLARLAQDAEAGVMPAGLTVRDAQDISRALNEASSAAWRAGDGGRGRVLGDLGKAIRQNARDEVPEYNAWLRQYSEASEVMDASRLGFSIFEKASERNPVSARQLRRAFDDMSDMEKDAFRRGVGDQLIEVAQTQGGVTAMRRLARGPEYRDRVRVAFPDDASFDRFIRSATDEVRMQNSANQTLAGSRTAPRAAAMDELSAANGLDTATAIGAAGDIVTLNAPSLLNRIGQGVARRFPNTGSNIIGNEGTNEVLGDALSDPAVLRRLLEEANIRQMLRDQSTSGRLRALTGPGVVGSGTNALNPVQ